MPSMSISRTLLDNCRWWPVQRGNTLWSYDGGNAPGDGARRADETSTFMTLGGDSAKRDAARSPLSRKGGWVLRGLGRREKNITWRQAVRGTSL